MTRRQVRNLVTVCLLLAAALVATLLAPDQRAPLPTAGTISKVLDGDTIMVASAGRDYRVRLIGVDTPEACHVPKLERDSRRLGRDAETIIALGRRATEFTRSLCLGKRCRLAYDQVNSHRGHRDRYGRLLAYVYVQSDGREVFLNAEILRAGYGSAVERFPYDEAIKSEFRRLAQRARRERRGLWAEGNGGL